MFVIVKIMWISFVYFYQAIVKLNSLLAINSVIQYIPIIIWELFMPKYEIILSVTNTNIDPSKKPPATGIKAYSPFLPYVPELSANSMAGASNDQNDAAIITPAANPSATSNDFL